MIAALPPRPELKSNAARRRSMRWEMKQMGNWKWPGLMLIGLGMLCSACSSGTPSLNSAAEAAAMPSLPSSARQPKAKPECEPTCSAGSERLFDSMLLKPTEGE